MAARIPYRTSTLLITGVLPQPQLLIAREKCLSFGPSVHSGRIANLLRDQGTGEARRINCLVLIQDVEFRNSGFDKLICTDVVIIALGAAVREGLEVSKITERITSEIS